MLLRGLYRRALFMKVMLPVGASICFVGVALAHRFTAYSGLTQRSIGELLAMAVMGYLVGCLLFLAYRGTVLRRQVRRRGLTCLSCGYSMKRLPRVGQCPECGSLYVRAVVAESWRELAGGRPKTRLR